MGKRIGSWIRHARLAQGLTQSQIAAKVGVSQGTVSNWEKGRAEPDKGERKELERILGNLGAQRASGESVETAAAEVFTGAGDSRLFGDWLRKTREKAGLSIFELATASAVSPAQIKNIEDGRSTNPREATRKRLEGALKTTVPEEIREEAAEEKRIEGLGSLTDFDPHSPDDRPTCPGVYVFYDISDRPVYVGKSQSIQGRVKDHADKFWFKFPIVSHAAYVEIADPKLRHQVEQILIRFLKSNAVINQQSVDRD